MADSKVVIRWPVESGAGSLMEASHDPCDEPSGDRRAWGLGSFGLLHSELLAFRWGHQVGGWPPQGRPIFLAKEKWTKSRGTKSDLIIWILCKKLTMCRRHHHWLLRKRILYKHLKPWDLFEDFLTIWYVQVPLMSFLINALRLAPNDSRGVEQYDYYIDMYTS